MIYLGVRYTDMMENYDLLSEIWTDIFGPNKTHGYYYIDIMGTNDTIVCSVH